LRPRSVEKSSLEADEYQQAGTSEIEGAGEGDAGVGDGRFTSWHLANLYVLNIFLILDNKPEEIPTHHALGKHSRRGPDNEVVAKTAGKTKSNLSSTRSFPMLASPWSWFFQWLLS
jgi:hypothetical protein